MRTSGEVVLVSGDAARECGAAVYWEMRGPVDQAALTNAWEAAGLSTDEVPGLPSPEEAMARAVAEQRSRRTLTRPLGGRGQGWVIVRERAVGAEDLDWTADCKVRLDALHRLTVTPDQHPLHDALTQAYYRHLGELSTADISSWLVRQALGCGGVALRQQGGMYFVPHTSLARWRTVVGVLRQVSGHSLYELAAMRTDELVAAVLDAVTREAHDAAEQIEGELADGSLGKRALQARVDRCGELARKLADYEALLDQKRDGVREQLERTRANLTVAMLASETPPPAEGS